LKSVSITGGTGFIGRYLVSKLLEQGIHVRLLTRNPKKIKKLWTNENIEACEGDLRNHEGSLAEFIQGADTVYNCAGEIQDNDNMSAVHVDGTRKICELAAGKISHWVQLSSVGAYGPVYNGLVTENSPINPIGVYERTKTESDSIVMDYSKKGAFSFTILRPSKVLGPGMADQSVFQLIKFIKKKLFFFVGGPGASANYVQVGNVANALLQCGINPTAKGQIYNLCEYRTIEKFVEAIALKLGRPITRLRIPKNLAMVLAFIFQILPGFPMSVSRIKGLTSRVIYSDKKIMEELGFRYEFTIEEGLHEMIDLWEGSADSRSVLHTD